MTARKKAYPLKMGEFYDTKDSEMIENRVDLPTIYMRSVTWSINVKEGILPNKKNGQRGNILESGNGLKTYKLKNMSIVM